MCLTTDQRVFIPVIRDGDHSSRTNLQKSFVGTPGSLSPGIPHEAGLPVYGKDAHNPWTATGGDLHQCGDPPVAEPGEMMQLTPHNNCIKKTVPVHAAYHARDKSA